MHTITVCETKKLEITCLKISMVLTVTLPLKFQHKLAFVDWLGVILIVNKILSNPLKFKHVQIFLGSTTILCKANLPNSISVLSKSTPILWLNRPWEPFTKLSSSCFQKMIFLSTGFCNKRLKFFNGDPDPFHFIAVREKHNFTPLLIVSFQIIG